MIMDISASQVKELRERTGAGILDCKNALVEAKGDTEQAVTILREKGLAKAAKKAGRVASEGAVLIRMDGDKKALMLELNCETDFVAKNDGFRELSKTMLDYFDRHGKEEGTLVDMQEKFYDAEIERLTTGAVAKIGENIRPRRFIRYAVKENGFVHSYVHMGGRIGVLVEIAATDAAVLAKPEVREMADDVAMHIAAMNPVCVAPEEFPASLIESEKAIYRVQVLEMGKPENMVDKIVEGKLRKFIAESTLVNQTFVKDQELTVGAYVKQVAKKAGAELKVVRFVRFELGEGVEKENKDFASEVQSQIGK
ncbi:MAG TPA: translation elongation factor Ts [bacterium]|nr:translation elongation factor Ts [bacterium]